MKTADVDSCIHQPLSISSAEQPDVVLTYSTDWSARTPWAECCRLERAEAL